MEVITIENLKPLSYDNDDICPVSLILDSIIIRLKKDKLELEIDCDPSGNYGRCYEEPYNSENVKILDNLDDICEYFWDDYFMIEFTDDPLTLIGSAADRFDDVTMEQVYTTDLNFINISSIDELARNFQYFEIRQNNTKTQLHFRLQSENYNCSNHGLIIDVDGNNIYMFLTYKREELVDKCFTIIENFRDYIVKTLALDNNYSLDPIKEGKILYLCFQSKLNTTQSCNLNIKEFREHIIKLEKIFPNISIRNMYISHTIIKL